MAVRYATRDQYASQLSALRLTALSGDDTTVQDACIETAANEVDIYLSASPTPVYASLPDFGQETISSLTISIAIYRLAERAGQMTDRYRESYDTAILRLRDIARGVGSLGKVGATAAPNPVQLQSADRIFRRDTSPEGSLGTMGRW